MYDCISLSTCLSSSAVSIGPVRRRKLRELSRTRASCCWDNIGGPGAAFGAEEDMVKQKFSGFKAKRSRSTKQGLKKVILCGRLEERTAWRIAPPGFTQRIN